MQQDNDNSRNVGISRMDLDTEETRETHNLYTESIRGSLKNIIKREYCCIIININISANNIFKAFYKQ